MRAIGIRRSARLALIVEIDLLQMLDPDLAALVQERRAAHGVEVWLNSPAEAVVGGADGVRAVRAVGAEMPCELVACAAGFHPDIAWLDGSGVAIGKGVLIDDRMQTNVSGIFAAGDIVEGDDSGGHRRVVATWPNAALGGRLPG